MCKSLVCKYGFLKKQKNPRANFSPFGRGSIAELSGLLGCCLSHSVEEFLTSHAAGLLRAQIVEASNSIAPSRSFMFHISLLRRTLQNVHCVCCECLTGGISHSPLSLVSGVGWNTEFFTCRWFSVISIFQPKSQTSSLEKNDNWWQNPWHAVTSNANLG